MTVYFELNNARAAARDLSQGLRLGATAQTLKASVMSLLPWRQQDIETGRAYSADATLRHCSAKATQCEAESRASLRSTRAAPAAKAGRQHANPQSRTLVASRVIECSRPDTDDLTARQCGARRLSLRYLRGRRR